MSERMNLMRAIYERPGLLARDKALLWDDSKKSGWCRVKADLLSTVLVISCAL